MTRFQSTAELAARLDINVCGGNCGLSHYHHRYGTIDCFGGLHFAPRRFTRRAARNLLLLIARAQREADPGYLNISLFDWQYLYLDSIAAQNLALRAGFRLPTRLFDAQRGRCRGLMARRNVAPNRYPRVREWLRVR